MKRKTLSVIIGLALLVLSFATQTASAFYDPAEQRWLNRDPKSEAGFADLAPAGAVESNGSPTYELVGNRPVGELDALGLLRFDKGCRQSDIERMKQELRERCETAKTNNCFRCLSASDQQDMTDFCNNIDKPTGPKVICEGAMSRTDCALKKACGWTRASGGIHNCVNLINDPTTSCGSPGRTLLQEAAHSVGGVGGDDAGRKNPDNRAYAIEKCAGCAVPNTRVLPPGY